MAEAVRLKSIPLDLSSTEWKLSRLSYAMPSTGYSTPKEFPSPAVFKPPDYYSHISMLKKSPTTSLRQRIAPAFANDSRTQREKLINGRFKKVASLPIGKMTPVRFVRVKTVRPEKAIFRPVHPTCNALRNTPPSPLRRRSPSPLLHVRSPLPLRQARPKGEGDAAETGALQMTISHCFGHLTASPSPFVYRNGEWEQKNSKNKSVRMIVFLRLDCPINDGIWQRFKHNLFDGRRI